VRLGEAGLPAPSCPTITTVAASPVAC
jgi:hypothetical protein